MSILGRGKALAWGTYLNGGAGGAGDGTSPTVEADELRILSFAEAELLLTAAEHVCLHASGELH
jgi:hypothetical protein